MTPEDRALRERALLVRAFRPELTPAEAVEADNTFARFGGRFEDYAAYVIEHARVGETMWLTKLGRILVCAEANDGHHVWEWNGSSPFHKRSCLWAFFEENPHVVGRRSRGCVRLRDERQEA